MRVNSTLRRRVAAVLMVVPLAVTAVPALANDDFTSTRDAYERSQQQLADSEASLEALGVAAEEATAAFLAVDAALTEARDRLTRLRAELTDAIRAQRRADREHDVAIRRLGQATMVMVTVRDALAEHGDDLDIEIVAAYKYGGSSAQFRGVVEALQESGSMTDFSVAYEQLRTGTVGQKRLVDAVTSLAQRLLDQRAIVEELHRQTEDSKNAAIAQRRLVERLTGEQTRLVGEIRRDRAERERRLAQLREEEAEYARQVESLQAESDALYEELRTFKYVGGAPGSKDLLWPTDGTVTSEFGFRVHPIFGSRRLHAGADIPAPAGQPIYAVADGTVLSAGVRGGYGNAVVIEHGEGMSTLYAHQSRTAATAGEQVEAGDLIGFVGSTGYSTGPHLHFEIRLSGTPVDPMGWY